MLKSLSLRCADCFPDGQYRPHHFYMNEHEHAALSQEHGLSPLIASCPSYKKIIQILLRMIEMTLIPARCS